MAGLLGDYALCVSKGDRMSKKSIIVIAIALLSIIVVINCNKHNNNRIILGLHTEGKAVDCEFVIGQTKEQIENTLVNEGILYIQTNNRDGVYCILCKDEVTTVKYWFVIGSKNVLSRIDQDHEDGNGLGTVLPRNYDHAMAW